MCFPVNIGKFLRKVFFIERLQWLLLLSLKLWKMAVQSLKGLSGNFISCLFYFHFIFFRFLFISLRFHLFCPWLYIQVFDQTFQGWYKNLGVYKTHLRNRDWIKRLNLSTMRLALWNISTVWKRSVKKNMCCAFKNPEAKNIRYKKWQAPCIWQMKAGNE